MDIFDNKRQREFELSRTQIIRTQFGCEITAVGKRRDGGTRYWCLKHMADATAKYGRPANACRMAHIPPVSADEVVTVNTDQYPGGVALWGAVPPIYDTTRLPLDRGIHVHARASEHGDKLIDQTYRSVKLKGSTIPPDGIDISELDAIYYMVSTIFDFDVCHVECTLCGHSHLDKDWFSVHPHQRHLCAGCGRHFRDTRRAIGNPIREMQDACSMKARLSQKATKTLSINQKDYAGGIQIWGSNPAIIWTAPKDEEEGIHLHAFKAGAERPLIDDTFSSVNIDGIEIDPAMVRTLMAQSALPHIEGRVVSMSCADCGKPEFHAGEQAFSPSTDQTCSKCGGYLYSSSRLRKVVSNPLIDILRHLGARASRKPQKHDIGLLPETI